MKLNLRELFKLSAIYTLIGALPPLLQLIVQPVMEGKNKLGPVDFSQLAILETIISLVFVLTIHSVSYSIGRLYYDYMDDAKGYKKLVATSFISVIGRGLLLLAIGFIFSRQIGALFSQPALQNFHSYGYVAIISGINRALINAASILYRNEKRVFRFVIINVGLAVFRTLFQIIGVFYWNMSFLGYAYGTAIGSTIVVLIMMIVIFYRSGVTFDRKIFHEMNVYGRPLFYFSLLNWGLSFSDRFFLESNPVTLGIYDNALKFALGIQLILQGLQSASQPEIFRFMKEGIMEKIEEIKKISNIQILQSELFIGLSILPTMLFLFLFYKTDVRLSAGIIGIVYTKYILISSMIIFAMPLYYMKITKAFFYINSSVVIINLGLNYLLIPFWGYYGAISASVLALLAQTLLIYYYQNKRVPIPWNLTKLLWFPISQVGVAIILEIIKIAFNLPAVLMSAILCFYIFSGVFILYQNEIKMYSKRIYFFLNKNKFQV